MIYLSDTIENYSYERYLDHLNILPTWRKEKALQYKKVEDRKRSVLVFVLLQHALRQEYGMTEVPEFVYNEFGKPFLPNLSIYFSLSHCKDAVACAVSNHEIGIDVESVVPYNPNMARKVCNAFELETLKNSKTQDADFIKLWTIKEAVSKYEGLGLSSDFRQMRIQDYYIYTPEFPSINCIMSVCYGKRENASHCNRIREIKYYLL